VTATRHPSIGVRRTVQRNSGPFGLVAILVLGLGACTADDNGTATPPGGTTSAASASSSAAPSTAAVGEGEFVNPVIDTDFPDPHLVRFGDTYYAYATGFRYSTSPDLVDWAHPRILELRSRWTSRDLWAPEVAETSAGYVLYYTGRSALETPAGELPAQCVGRAVAETPDGPFVDELTEPWLCQPDEGGTIDASPFVDADGTRWLLYKNDGNCCNRPVRIWVQQLSEDGLSLAGEPVDTGIEADNRWEGAVIEAPTLWLHEGTYFLFYSANAYYDASYAVGYATATQAMGPYVEAEENPILHATFEDLVDDPSLVAAGPGHQSIVADDGGGLWLAYHAWNKTAIGYERGGDRTMWIDRLRFSDGRPVVDGPTGTPQEAP
jgi:beta-xylosidase